MNSEEMRIAIAVAMGTHTCCQEMWKWEKGEEPRMVRVVRDREGDEWIRWHEGLETWKPKFRPIPPLTLDWMHEVEKTLSEDLKDKYWCEELPKITNGNSGWMHRDIPRIAGATAEQRAEAYLRVKNMWRKEPND